MMLQDWKIRPPGYLYKSMPAIRHSGVEGGQDYGVAFVPCAVIALPTPLRRL